MTTKELAKASIDELTFSVVDVETTGMNASHNRIMDIGIVTVRNGRIVQEWEALINPQQEISFWITFYTHLTSAHVSAKPPFAHFFETIRSLLGDSVFVAHNAGFDYSFLQQEYKRNGYEFFMPKLCTVQLGRKLLPELANAHLDAISDYYGIKISERHRALPDAQATAQILLNFIQIAKEKYNAKTFFDLARLQQLRIDRTLSNSIPTLFSNYTKNQ